LTLRSYRWLNVLFLPVFIVSFLALAFGWVVLFNYLGEKHALTFEAGVFLFQPFSYGLICAVPCLFLGIFSTLPLLVPLAYFLMGRERFLEYLYWDEGRLSQHRPRPEGVIRLLAVLALILGVVCGTFTWLAMNWYARFTEEGIAVKRLLGFGEEFHPYESVEQIVLTSHRRIGKDTEPGQDLGLRFRDGRTWYTDQTFALPGDPAERDRLLEFLQRKTGKPITRARLLKDVPGF
jgi:hypothetical protein